MGKFHIRDRISFLFRMAHRHLMAVCVVCLLCAEHLPCKEHVLVPSKSIMSSLNSPLPSENVAMLTKTADIPGIYLYDKRKDKTKEIALSRAKRHADHAPVAKHHHNEIPPITKTYIEKIFKQFSSSDTMDVGDFDKMVAKLDLTNLLTNQSTVNNNNLTCMDSMEFLGNVTHFKAEEDHDHEGHEHEHAHKDHDHDEDDHHHPSTFRDRIKIGAEHMLEMCPILLYHIVNRDSKLEALGCVDSSNFKTIDDSVDEDEEKALRSTIWLYSTLSIIGVSLCGLLGVAVIPIMEKHFYHHVLQFLVALAVGTLAGDALLHLLPHAMMPLPMHEGQDIHKMMMLRGLAAVGGIVFFYFFERFLTMITEWRQRKMKRDKPSSRVRVMRDTESVSLNNGAAPACKHKYSNYPYCYDEITMETKDDHHEHQHIEEGILNNQIDKLKHHEDSILTPTDGKKINGLIGDHTFEADNNTLSTSLDEGSIAESNALCNNNKHLDKPIAISGKKDSVQEESYTIILREHQSKHHGHSHTHGHVHSPPESLSAVVWMVILGDGLHNFADGMAIGAAFSNNIAGGLSTAVAVFCHELPHELGDFAVLLKAGMSAKQAVYYNILSSILSFFGMCVGILAGDTPEASQWIFAIAAGLFIYIALVDMMPELTSSHGKEDNCMLSQCFLQFLGMTCGFSTMLLIAMYENDLKNIFAAS